MGFDVVSVGELKRALKAGAKADKIVFSSVGKSVTDLTFAAEQGIYSINIESHHEIELLKEYHQKKKDADLRYHQLGDTDEIIKKQRDRINKLEKDLVDAAAKAKIAAL